MASKRLDSFTKRSIAASRSNSVVPCDGTRRAGLFDGQPTPAKRQVGTEVTHLAQSTSRRVVGSGPTWPLGLDSSDARGVHASPAWRCDMLPDVSIRDALVRAVPGVGMLRSYQPAWLGKDVVAGLS